MNMIIITTFLLAIGFIKINGKERLFVFEHVRHGARGPWQALDENYKDIFGEQWNGMGEITPSGLRMHYLLGVRNRKVYDSFISSNYNPNEILIISTDVNRTIASINAHMQGLYPEKTGPILSHNQILNGYPPNIHTEAIEKAVDNLQDKALPNQIDLLPIHIFNPHDKVFLMNSNNNCPGVIKYKTKAENSAEIKKIQQEEFKHFNDTFGEKLFNYFSINDPYYYYNRKNIYDIADIFINVYIDGRDMKKFKETGIDFEAFYQECLYVTYFDTFYLEFWSKNNIIAIMAGSPTFRSILGWMDKRISLHKEGKGQEIKATAPKMIIYSGHDTTIATIGFFMEEVFKVKAQESIFAANQYFELVIENSEYKVEYYFNDDLKFTISYNEFKKKVQNKLWTAQEIDDFCQEVGLNYFMIASCVLGPLMLILGVVLGIMIWFRSKHSLPLLATEA